MEDARQKLQSLGASPATADRFLYSASNPIGEECFRECGFTIGEDLVNEVARDAAPWIDLWRDCYAFVASRVSAGLRGGLEKAPTKNGAVPLPAFLRVCEQIKMPLTGPALVGLAHMAFQEVKAAFRQQIASRADSEELQLTADDCHFVRKKFQYPKFDDYTYPSADMLISARRNAGTRAGELFHRRRSTSSSTKSRATSVCARALRANTSVRSRAAGRFRSGFIRSYSAARRTCRGCVAAK